MSYPHLGEEQTPKKAFRVTRCHGPITRYVAKYNYNKLEKVGSLVGGSTTLEQQRHLLVSGEPPDAGAIVDTRFRGHRL